MSEIKVKQISWYSEHWYKILVDEKVETDEGTVTIEVPKYLPSVTTKLSAVSKPGLAQWRGDIGNAEADMRMYIASKRGTIIHGAFENLLLGGVVIYQPIGHENYTAAQIEKIKEKTCLDVVSLKNQDEMYDAWKLKMWIDAIKPTVHIQPELVVYDIDNNEAGTADLIAYIEEGEYQVNGSKPIKLKAGYYVVDLKTGKSVYDDAYMQVSCYAKMAEKNYDIKVEGAMIVHTQGKTRTGIQGLSTIVRNKEDMENDYNDFRAVSKIWERKNKNAAPRLLEFPSLLHTKEVK